MIELVKGRKYRVFGRPLWANGETGSLCLVEDRLDHVVFSQHYSSTEAEVHGYAADGTRLVTSAFIDKRRLLPYPGTAPKTEGVSIPPDNEELELGTVQLHRVALLDLVAEKFPSSGLADILNTARWLNGEAS